MVTVDHRNKVSELTWGIRNSTLHAFVFISGFSIFVICILQCQSHVITKANSLLGTLIFAVVHSLFKSHKQIIVIGSNVPFLKTLHNFLILFGGIICLLFDHLIDLGTSLRNLPQKLRFRAQLGYEFVIVVERATEALLANLYRGTYQALVLRLTTLESNQSQTTPTSEFSLRDTPGIFHEVDSFCFLHFYSFLNLLVPVLLGL